MRARPRGGRPRLVARPALAGLVLGLGLAAPIFEGSARAEPWTPVLSAGAILHGDRVAVEAPGGGALGQDERATFAPALGLGLAIPLAAPVLGGEPLVLVPRAALALGLVRGDGRLGLGVDAALVYLRTGALALSAGLGVSASLGLAAPASSYGAITAIAAVRLGPVELAWRPALLVPLAAAERPVYGGTHTQGVPLQLAPLGLLLSVELDALAF